MDGQIQMQLGASGSFFLPPFFSLCTSHTLSCCTPTSHIDGNLLLPGSARLSSFLVSPIPGKSSDWPSLNRSTGTKRTKCKKHGGSLGKHFPKRWMIYVPRREKKLSIRAQCFQEWKPTRLLSQEYRGSSFRLHHSEIPWTFRFSSTLIELYGMLALCYKLARNGLTEYLSNE